MEHPILQEARAMEQELVAWRRALHQMPELGLSLPQTSGFVQARLGELGIPYEVLVDGSCVVGRLGAGQRCFLLRCDMDGLPIREESGESFAAENGRMHACGHDLHTTFLLGAAKLLKAHEAELKGTVKLLFQPGEETFQGAKAALDAGVLENPGVEAAFAMHVAAAGDVGVFAYGRNPMSSVYGFRIHIQGVGGHGSTPELCVDPINAGVHIHLALQALIARECPASEEAVLTVGRFQSGQAPNIIPNTAVLEGTLRTFSPKAYELLVRRIGEAVPAVAQAYGATATVEVLSNVPCVTCDAGLNAEICQSLQALSPDFSLREVYHTMGSEDFAFFSQALPVSSYFAIGAGLPRREARRCQHNPKVRFNEACLPLGAAAYAKAALDYLAHRQQPC